MADAAAARREARKRRILENSNNRLQLIAGKSGTESPKLSASPIRYHNLEQPLEVPVTAVTSESSSICKSSLNNGVLFEESESFPLLLSRHDRDTVAAGDSQIANDFPSIQTASTESVQTQTFWEKLTIYKYDIVLLSLIIQMLYGLSLASLDNSYIFLPFAIYGTTKQIFFPVQNNSKLANALMLLNGLSGQANTIQKALNISQYMGAFLQDIFVYLFTMICVQSVYVALRDSFIT